MTAIRIAAPVAVDRRGRRWPNSNVIDELPSGMILGNRDELARPLRHDRNDIRDAADSSYGPKYNPPIHATEVVGLSRSQIRALRKELRRRWPGLFNDTWIRGLVEQANRERRRLSAERARARGEDPGRCPYCGTSFQLLKKHMGLCPGRWSWDEREGVVVFRPTPDAPEVAA